MDYEILRSVKQLAQVRPASNAAASVFAKAQKRKVSITSINIINTTGSTATYSIFLDSNGTTYDATTAIAYNTSLAANTQVLLEFTHGLPIDPEATGHLAVQVGTANAITFTVNGIEF